MAKRFRPVAVPGGVPGKCLDVRLFPREKVTGFYYFDDFNNGLNLWVEVWEKSTLILKSQTIPSNKTVPGTEVALMGVAVIEATSVSGVAAEIWGDPFNDSDSERVISVWHSDVGTLQTLYMEIDSP